MSSACTVSVPQSLGCCLCSHEALIHSKCNKEWWRATQGRPNEHNIIKVKQYYGGVERRRK